MKLYRIYITGIVQQVGFRYYASKIAKENGIRGWVKNLNDGRVEIAAQADEEEIQLFLQKLKEGYLGSNISAIDKHVESSRENFSSFNIKF